MYLMGKKKKKHQFWSKPHTVSENVAAASYREISQTAMKICSKIKTYALVEHVRLVPQRCVLAEVFSHYFYSLHFKSFQLLQIHGQCHDNVQ